MGEWAEEGEELVPVAFGAAGMAWLDGLVAVLDSLLEALEHVVLEFHEFPLSPFRKSLPI